jgi:hypothetical protein
MASSPHNAGMVAEAVGALVLEPDDRLILLGYSKGAPDILHFLVGYPHLAERVRAVVSVSGAVNGSPLADGVSRTPYRWLARPATLWCEGRDLGMLQSLRRGTLLRWLAANPLPEHVTTFSLGAFTDRSHVARLLQVPYDLLAQVDPRNDGQLVFTDQIVPGSTLLGYANADHWAVAMALEERRSFWMSHPGRERAFPRALLFEAIVRFVAEKLAAEDRGLARPAHAEVHRREAAADRTLKRALPVPVAARAVQHCRPIPTAGHRTGRSRETSRRPPGTARGESPPA